MTKSKLSLRELYQILELPGRDPIKTLQEKLDRAVREAYGFSAKSDLLSELLALNERLFTAEKAGKTITAPGLPDQADEDFVSDDFVRLLRS